MKKRKAAKLNSVNGWAIRCSSITLGGEETNCPFNNNGCPGGTNGIYGEECKDYCTQWLIHHPKKNKKEKMIKSSGIIYAKSRDGYSDIMKLEILVEKSFYQKMYQGLEVEVRHIIPIDKQ